MKNRDRLRFTDPSVIKKIKALENSTEVQEKLATVRENMKSRTFSLSGLKNPIIIGILFSIFFFTKFTYRIILYLIIIFGIKYFSDHLRKNKTLNKNAYVDNFLLPVLKEIFPETEIDYSKGLKIYALKNFLPNEEEYFGNCYIKFGDEFNTEFSNFKGVHYTTDDEGNRTRVTDFVGQGLFVKMQTNINGHIRVVPVTKKSVFGNKKYGIYGKKIKEEKEIETESIEFNDSYSIFSTDDFYTRLILDPNIIQILNSWKDRMQVILYMNEKYISIAFKSNEYIFQAPNTKAEIDQLSLSGEYDKIREKLVDFYSLIDIITDKL